MPRLKIAYIIEAPGSEGAWSGMSVDLGRALREYVGEVDFIGPVRDPWWLKRILRITTWVIRRISGSEYAARHSILRIRYVARILDKQMKGHKYDFICATDAWSGLGYIRSKIPVICISDTTFRLSRSGLEKLSKFSIWEGNRQQGRFLRNSLLTVFASQWAARSALSDYRVPRERIAVVPPGASIDLAPDAAVIERKFDNPRLTLFFHGTDWESKGGPIVFDTLTNLHTIYDIDARLLVCGCIPPPEYAHPAMEIIPLPDRDNPGEYARLLEWLSVTHFLLQPSRTDATLLVACDGNAFGIPVITTETGGIPDVVQDGVNGYCLPYHSDGRMYSLLISELFQDQEQYRQLVYSSRSRYEERLNWKSWAQRFREIYDRAIHAKVAIKEFQDKS